MPSPFKISPDEVYARGELLRWMRDMGWSLKIVNAIMYRDMPTPEAVRRLVWRHGPDRAYEIILRMAK